MRLLVLIWVVFGATSLFGAACCSGGSPKSFISLSRLQNHEIGLSTTFRQVYSFFNAYGEQEEAQKNQTTSVTLGVGTRLSQDFQVSAILPFVRQVTGANTPSREGVGDATVSAQYTAVESLFSSDWYPTLHLIAGVKLPTGLQATKDGKQLLPGTGNGKWEPFVALGMQKNFGPVTLALRSAYTARLLHENIDSGDAIELVESLSYLFSERLSVALGSAQTWTWNDKIDGLIRPDTNTRAVSVFVSPTYFLNRYWSVSTAVDGALPIERIGVNSQAALSFSLTSRYGFY